MKISEKYEIEVRRIAKDFISKEEISEGTISLGTYILDINERTEKTILNKMEKELTEKIEYRKELGLTDKVSEKMLQIVKERKADIKEEENI